MPRYIMCSNFTYLSLLPPSLPNSLYSIINIYTEKELIHIDMVDFDFIISVYMLYKCKFSLSIMLCQFIIINIINNNSLNIKP